MVQIGYLTAKFDADVAKFIQDVGKAGKSLESLEKTVSGSVKTINGALGALGVGVSVGAIFKRMIDEASQAESAAKKVDAILRATGGAAGVTAKQVDDLASSLSRMSGLDDDAIKGGQALLLTFKNIGKDVFPAASQAMLDISETMGVDLKSAAVQVGKALNDPVKGMTALRKEGIQLSDAQEALVKQFAATGQMAKAQAVILREIQGEMGGAAAAARDTYAGALKALDTSFGNLMETMGNIGGLEIVRNGLEGLIIVIEELDASLQSTAFKQWFNDISIAAEQAYIGLKPFIDTVEKLMRVNDFLTKKLTNIKGPKALLDTGLDFARLADDLKKTGDDYLNVFDQWAKKFEEKRKALADKAKKGGLTTPSPGGSLAALGLPSDKDFEAYLAQQKRILDTFDLDKVFADKVQNIAGDQVAAMSKFTNALLDSTKDKIESLEAYKKSLGDSDADKAAKKSIDLQLDKYKQLKSELEDQNKELEKQWALVSKVGEAQQKQIEDWKKQQADLVILRANEAAQALDMVKSIEKQTELLKAKNSEDKDQLAILEAQQKLEGLKNLTAEQRELRLNQLVEAQKKLNEVEAEGNSDKMLKTMQEANELLAAKVAGVEDEYEAQKKLKELLKDVQDPAKIDEFTRKYWDQVDATKAYKQAIDDQKKTLDGIKNSTDSYVQKYKALSDAMSAGKINAKQYKETLEELQKKQMESVKKGVTDWTNKIFDSFSQAITQGKNLKEVFKDLGKELGLLAAKKMVFEPIANAIGNYASKLYGGTMFGAPGSTGGGTAVASGGGGLLAGLGGLFGGLFGGGSKMPPLAPNYSKAPSIAGLPQSGSVSGNGSALSGGGLVAGPIAAGYDGKPIGSDIMGSVAPAWFREWYTKSHTNVVGIGSAMKVIDGAMYALLQSCGGSDSLATKFDYIGDIRNTLKFAELSTSGGTSLRVWVANFGAEAKPQGMFKNPLRSGNSNALKDTGSGGFSLYADNLIPLIQSLTAMSSKGLAWKVINPDCPCGPSGDLKSPTITGSSGGLTPSPALSDPSGVLRGAYNPSADQIARANGTYKSPTISLSGGVSTMPTTGMTGAWGYQQRGLNGTLLPTSGMIGSAPEYDEYMRRAAAMRQAGNFTGTLPTQANFKSSSAAGFTPDPFYLTGSPYSAVSATDYAEPPNVTPGFSGGVNKSPMYAKSTATAANTIWERYSPSGWDNLGGPYISPGTSGATATLSGGGGLAGITAKPSNGLRPQDVSPNYPTGPDLQYPTSGPSAAQLDAWRKAAAANPLNQELIRYYDSLGSATAPGASSPVSSADYKAPKYLPQSGPTGNYGNYYADIIKKAQADMAQKALPFQGFANGGNPPVGIPSIVGERGPELFVPRQSGTVLPNDRLKSIMGGGNTPVVHLHDYTETKSQISDTRFAQDGSLHITLRDVVANLQNDPKVRKAANKATGTKSRGRLKT